MWRINLLSEVLSCLNEEFLHREVKEMEVCVIEKTVYKCEGFNPTRHCYVVFFRIRNDAQKEDIFL